MGFHKILALLKKSFYLVFINLFIFILIFVAAEMIFRHFYVYPPDAQNLALINDRSHVAKPYVMFTAKPFTQKYNMAGPESRINKLGYVGELPPKIKEHSTYRIFILGGSTVFNGDPAFSLLLQNIFAANGESNVEVYNYGIVSSVTRQELVRTLIEISTYQPDLIISFSGYNDVFNTGWDRRVNYPHRFILFENNPLLKLRATDFPFMLNILLSSEICRKLFEDKILSSIVDQHGVMPVDREIRQQVAAKAYIQNLRLTHALAHDFGSQFVAFFQPTVYFKKPLDPHEDAILKSYASENAPLIRKYVLEEYAKFRTEFKFIDSSEIFNGQPEQVFQDPVHYQFQSGNAFVANYLYKEIKKNINMKIRGKSLLPNLVPEDEFILDDGQK